MERAPTVTGDSSEIVIDGSHGEGGGQIVRSVLALSAITGRACRIVRIRAGRAKPGLQPQHLAAVRAAATLCNADVHGGELGSDALRFRPNGAPRAGEYVFDVAEARLGGSAGAATLVLQTAALPAFFAEGISVFRIRGGTHVPRSPPFDYIADAWCPLLKIMNLQIGVELTRFGFYPAGGGEIVARIEGRGRDGGLQLRPVTLIEKGALRSVKVRAVGANLPDHVPRRMAERARTLLQDVAPRLEIREELASARSAGAGIFLCAAYDQVSCAFSALGARGKPSEVVAEEAVAQLLRHRSCGAALESHLADQILLQLALPNVPSSFTTEDVTSHLQTNAWVIEQFGLARIAVETRGDGTAVVKVNPSTRFSVGRAVAGCVRGDGVTSS
ncbi:RNA 3'-terminal phosphate cyclase [Methylosinus sp. KRF6]|uniref:RNA 3'-terminal phosphate cyclase n=1 Tax=Methylosinus sp. KRF6 TaxID=2846853 RepID=UPI002110F197|nr:RNA 3'-terminal phosphate cyclase [Methylosinus sp. KRF6]